MGVDDNPPTAPHDRNTSLEHEDVRVYGTPAVSPRAHAHELYTCKICAKQFGNRRVLQLHVKMHQFNDKTEHKICQTTTNNERLSYGDEQTPAMGSLTELKQQNKISTSREQLLFQCSAAAKKVGLKKIRLEDCFRCDACSCIYLEEEDYRKHMRNFHRDPLQKHKQKKACKSCCRHCNFKGDHNHVTDPSSSNLHFNIKDRWRKMVSTRMDSTKTPISIKTEPELEDCDDVLDYSHLLSQVEVRIKTEPEDDKEH